MVLLPDKKPRQMPSLDEVLAGDFSFQDEAPAKEEAAVPPQDSPRVIAVTLTEGGVKIIGRGRIRILGAMISSNGGQFGRTGQGGGASGGKAKPKRGSGTPGPPPEARLWWGGVAKERHDHALDFNLKPVVSGGGEPKAKAKKKKEAKNQKKHQGQHSR